MAHCAGQNARGLPCGAAISDDRQWCFWHDPETTPDQLRAAVARGGKTGHQRAAVAKLAFQLSPLAGQTSVQLLEAAIFGVLTGAISPKAGQAAANLLRTRLLQIEANRNELSAEASAAIRTLHNLNSLEDVKRHYARGNAKS